MTDALFWCVTEILRIEILIPYEHMCVLGEIGSGSQYRLGGDSGSLFFTVDSGHSGHLRVFFLRVLLEGSPLLYTAQSSSEGRVDFTNLVFLLVCFKQTDTFKGKTFIKNLTMKGNGSLFSQDKLIRAWNTSGLILL